MPEHAKVYILLVAVALPIFHIAGLIACPRFIRIEDFRLRRDAWFFVVSTGFFAHNFWIFIGVVGIIAFLYAKKDHQPLGLYFTLLFALPWHSKGIPGFGLVNFLIEVDYFLILNVSILVPLLVKTLNKQNSIGIFKCADISTVGFIVYRISMGFSMDMWTSSVRQAIDATLTLIVPYFAIRRNLISTQAVAAAVVGLLTNGAILGFISPFESITGWLIYDSLRQPWDLPPPLISIFLTRGEFDLLRAVTSFDHTIVFGFSMMLGLLVALFANLSLSSYTKKIIMISPFLLGIIFSLSRGPWLGVLCGVILGASILKVRNVRNAVMVVGSLVFLTVGSTTSISSHIKDAFNFAVTMDSGSIEYRAKLIDIGMMVFWQAPWFGRLDYAANPIMEQMRQGQGIIDVVNSYLGIALAYGIVGLVLYLLCPMCALWVTTERLAKQKCLQGSRKILAGALALQVATLVLIATVSSIGAIGPSILMICGAALALTEKLE